MHRSYAIGFILSISCASTGYSDPLPNEYEDYLKKLKVLTISDPKPAVANIAGGFGASNGLVYAAISYSDFDLQTNDRDDDDGSIALGVGLGDPINSIGTEITVGITSVSTSLWGDGKFADEGNISVKFHRRVKPIFNGNVASISLGASNVAGWGSTTDNPVNYYGAFSEQINFGSFKQYGLAYTFGYGSAVSDTETQGDLFGGFAFGYDDYSVSISAIGRETHLSGTYYIPNLEGVGLSVTQADAFDKMNSKRMILTLSISKSLTK
jgi:hypothetical protein